MATTYNIPTIPITGSKTVRMTGFGHSHDRPITMEGNVGDDIAAVIGLSFGITADLDSPPIPGEIETLCQLTFDGTSELTAYAEAESTSQLTFVVQARLDDANAVPDEQRAAGGPSRYIVQPTTARQAKKQLSERDLMLLAAAMADFMEIM